MTGLQTACRIIYVALAMFCAGRALAYSDLLAAVAGSTAQEPPPAAVQLISAYIPVDVWSIGWAIACLAALFGLWRPETVSIMPAAVMGAVWFVAYAASWAIGRAPNAWLTTLTYQLILTLLVAGSWIAGRAVALAHLIEKDTPR